MFKIKSGRIYNSVVCGCCENNVHIAPLQKTPFALVLYQNDWGKSEYYGFVCHDCIPEIVGHVWIQSKGYTPFIIRAIQSNPALRRELREALLASDSDSESEV
jgi:hypothetical protein